MLDEHEPGRPDPRDLTAELGADRAARTRDEHGLAGEVLRDRAHVDLDRLAAEHVLHLNGTDLPGEIEIAGDQLVQPRQRLDGNVRSLGDLDHLLACLARSGRDRDQHLVRWVVPQDVRQVVCRAEHADAVQTDVLLARGVVDEADRRIAARGRLEHLADHELRRITRSNDDHLLAARHERRCAGPFDQAARKQPRARDQREQDQPVEHRNRAREWKAVDRVGEVNGEVGDDARSGDAPRRAPHVAGGNVTPPTIVEAERDEDRELDRDDDEDRVDHQAVIRARDALVEPQPERKPPGKRNERGVREQLPEPMPVDGNHEATGTDACTTETT